MTADIRLGNAAVNSGNYVILQASSFIPGALQRGIQVEPIAGQRSGTGTEFVISKGDRNGIENPVHKVKGIIDLNDFETDDDLWATTGITHVNLGYLYAVWRNMTVSSYLLIPLGIDSTLSWRSYDGVSTVYGIPVEIESIVFSPSDDSEMSHIINYEITMREIRLT